MRRRDGMGWQIGRYTPGVQGDAETFDFSLLQEGFKKLTERPGIAFSSQAIRETKDRLTDLRDVMLIGAPWEDTKLLTHVIIYLTDYIIKMEREEREEQHGQNKDPA